ncbi:MAG: hypothetical protein Phyf2KO_09290 [Phycisphaerales bacterium]
MPVTRRNFILGSSALTLGACLAPSAFARPGRVGEILDWTGLTDHTKAVVNLALGGNSMIVASGGQALVIDAKFPYLGPVLYEDASAEGAEVSLINTHHHGDHTGGNNAFVGRCNTYAHPKAIDRIRDQIGNFRSSAEASVGQAVKNLKDKPRVLELAQQVAEVAGELDAEDFVPQSTLDHGDSVKVGDLAVEIHHFGSGHTDNDLVIRLESENVIHTGDLVFHGTHPFYFPAGGATARGWVESLDGILNLCDNDTVVVPGHGEVGGKEIVEGMRDYHLKLIDAVQAEIDKGTSKEDAQQMTWPFMDGLQFEQIKGRAIGAVYDELSAE